MNYKLICGNSLEELKKLEDNSIDSVVTDPPYELGFLNKSWDKTGIAYNEDLWKECLRVLKPGGHLLSFSGSRTYHRIAVAIENAGFEIRDQMLWLYGTGFPKSLDIGKAIEGKLTIGSSNTKDQKKLSGEKLDKGNWGMAKLQQVQGYRDKNYDETSDNRLGKLEPTTEDAKQWNGWGTALKPAHEPICFARKPLSEKTVAENVLKWGVGALNIDESRVGNESEEQGRWPANIIHNGLQEEWSRFFYCAKASKKDRNSGCDGLPLKPGGSNAKGYTEDVAKGLDRNKPVANFHPTVKPTDLMKYLIRLVTPKGGVVLDPFNGSGSTGKACAILDFDYIGIDLSQEYIDISKARIENELKIK